MTLAHDPDTFTDVFLLVHVDGRWRIADKAYHRHRGDSASGRRPAVRSVPGE